jgi:hypothetical protein
MALIGIGLSSHAQFVCSGVRSKHVSGRVVRQFTTEENITDNILDSRPSMCMWHGARWGVVVCAGRKASSQPSSYSQSSGPPAWKRFAKKDKTLGRQAEATLEMIWSKTEWLTDEHIQGMWDMHRVRKDVVVAWFAEKRRQRRKPSSSSVHMHTSVSEVSKEAADGEEFEEDM